MLDGYGQTVKEAEKIGVFNKYFFCFVFGKNQVDTLTAYTDNETLSIPTVTNEDIKHHLLTLNI